MSLTAGPSSGVMNSRSAIKDPCRLVRQVNEANRLEEAAFPFPFSLLPPFHPNRLRHRRNLLGWKGGKRDSSLGTSSSSFSAFFTCRTRRQGSLI